MVEEHFAEIERALLYVSDAREQIVRTMAELRRADADEHLITALGTAERELAETHKRLMQGTYFAVPSSQLAAL